MNQTTLDEIKKNYMGQKIKIVHLSTTTRHHSEGIVVPSSDGWESYIKIDSPNVRGHINKNRIQEITTPDGKVWKNETKVKYKCNRCGYTTTDEKLQFKQCPKPKCYGFMDRVGRKIVDVWG
jgi:late competence protein required for DNA uptake (superfamily II DNA/RNA helicase)